MAWTTEKEILFLVEKGLFGLKCISVYQVWGCSLPPPPRLPASPTANVRSPPLQPAAAAAAASGCGGSANRDPGGRPFQPTACVIWRAPRRGGCPGHASPPMMVVECSVIRTS